MNLLTQSAHNRNSGAYTNQNELKMMERNDVYEKATPESHLEYAGFWVRVGATVIDTLLLMVIIVPLLTGIYGPGYYTDGQFISGPADFFISWVAPAIATVLFWLFKDATPGKMALSLRVIDERTGKTLTVGQAMGRYLGYFVSAIPLLLGFVWVGMDSKKQGWHDKLAGTVVVRAKPRGPQPVRFER